MPNDLFSDQARERPDASSPTGKKYVYEDEPSDEDIPTLPDGRFDGEGKWSREAIKAVRFESPTHTQIALHMLYQHQRITERMFWDLTGSFKLRARISDLRKLDATPPILTDEETEPTTYFIPQANTSHAS